MVSCGVPSNEVASSTSGSRPFIHASFRIRSASVSNHEQTNPSCFGAEFSKPHLLCSSESRVYNKLPSDSLATRNFGGVARAQSFVSRSTADFSNLAAENRNSFPSARPYEKSRTVTLMESDDIRPSSSGAYAEDVRAGAGIDKIPRGAVRQKLKLFGGSFSKVPSQASVINRQQSYTVPREAFDLILENKRTSNRESEQYPQENLRRHGIEQLSTPSLRHVSSTLPNSYILLRKSQEALSLKRNEALARSSAPSSTSLTFDGNVRMEKMEAARHNSVADPGFKDEENVCEKTVVKIDGPIYQRPVVTKPLHEVPSSYNRNANELSKSSTWNGPIKPEVIYDQPCTGVENAKTIEIPVVSTNSRVLIAQLASSKELNRELAVKLAKAERDVQALRVQLNLVNESNEAEVASKVADAVAKMKSCSWSGGRFERDVLNASQKLNIIENGSRRTKTLEALLKELEGEGPRPLSPNTIRRNCDRMMEFVKEYGCSVEENDIERLPKVKGLFASMGQKDGRNGDAPITRPCSGSQISVSVQDVKTQGDLEQEQQISALRGKVGLLQAELSMKDTEISRLEEEIGNAHRCNQQLNAKIGSLSVGNIGEHRNQDKELRKSLKERTSECETLKKKIEKFERERQQWENQKKVLESKQPMDVQVLQSQKRELTMQLDREQAEKHELFLQINTLIAQVAEANREASEKQNSSLLKTENDQLKLQLGSIQKIQGQLNSDLHALEDELRRKTNELESAKDDASKRQAERKHYEESIQELERELQMKSAALQSLMLAKKDKINDEEQSRLSSENAELKRKMESLSMVAAQNEKEMASLKATKEQEYQDLRKKFILLEETLQEKEAELDEKENELKQKSREVAAQKQRVDSLQISSGDTKQSIEALERALSEKTQAHETAVREIAALKKSATDIESLTRQLEDAQQALKDTEQKRTVTDRQQREKDNRLRTLEEEMATKVNVFEEKIRKLENEVVLRKNEEKSLVEELKKQEARAVEAEHEAKSSGFKLMNLQTEIKSLKSQIESQHDVDEQVKYLRDELHRFKERNAELSEAVEEAEAKADEAEKSNRETIDELEEELRSMQEQLGALERTERDFNEKLKALEKEKSLAVEKNNNLESTASALTKKLAETEAEVLKTQKTLKELEAENAKLLAKPDLEDEVLTLATSLQSAREESSTLQNEITELRKQVRGMQQENDRLVCVNKQIEILEDANLKAANESQDYAEQIARLKSELQSQREAQETYKQQSSEELNRIRQQHAEKESQLTLQLTKLGEGYKKELSKVEGDRDEKLKEQEEAVGKMKEEHERLIREVEQARALAVKEKFAHEQEEVKKELVNLQDTNAQLTTNVRELNKVVEAKSEEVQNVNDKLRALEAERDRLQGALSKTETENVRLSKDLQDQAQQMAKVNEKDEKQQISELMAENARLAGELLKLHNASDKENAREREDLKVEFMKQMKEREEEWETRIKEEKERQRADVEKLKMDVARRTQLRDEEWSKKVETVLKENHGQMESLRLKNEELKKERDRLKAASKSLQKEEDEIRVNKDLCEAKERLKQSENENRNLMERLEAAEARLSEYKDDLAKLRHNGVSPVPPPRRTHAASDVSDISVRSSTPTGTEDENKKLKAEVEKQRRLIVVLRRKLQSGGQPS